MAWKATMTFADGTGPTPGIFETKEEAEQFVEIFKVSDGGAIELLTSMGQAPVFSIEETDEPVNA